MSGWREEELAVLDEVVTSADTHLGTTAVGAGWADAVRDLPSDDRAAEQRIDDAVLGLRRSLLRATSATTHDRYRSPVHRRPLTLPGGAPQRYSYERSMPATALEDRLAAANAPSTPDGWTTEHLLFSSCMSALLHVVQSCVSLLRDGPPLRLSHAGSYFETDLTLEYLSGDRLHWQNVRSVEEALEADDTDVLVLEPVRYDWDLSTVDLDAVSRVWKAGHRRPRVVVVDTTLAGFTWPRRAVLEMLRDGDPLLVVEVRSGLKLDQQGLELANVGVVSLSSVDEGPGTPTAGQLAETLRLVRGACGAAVSAEASAALDLPFALEPGSTRRHAGRVFLNNARVAAEVPTGGVFATVAHPSTGGRSGPLRHAPFVVLQLADDTLPHHGLLLAALRHEVERRGSVLDLGSSFGFRGSRCETIIPRLSTAKGLFKVAAGARRGPQLDDLVEALQTLAALPDMAAVRAAYPSLRPTDLGVFDQSAEMASS